MRVCKRNSPVDRKISEEGGGGGGAPGDGAEIHLPPVEKIMVRQAVPMQPVEVYSGENIHLQPIEDPTSEKVHVPEGGCDPMGSQCWSRLLTEPVAPWREDPMLEQVCWQDPVGDPLWSSLFLKDCTPWNEELTATPIPCPSAQMEGRR